MHTGKDTEVKRMSKRIRDRRSREEGVRGANRRPDGTAGVQAICSEADAELVGDYEIKDRADQVCKVALWIEYQPTGNAVGAINKRSSVAGWADLTRLAGGGKGRG